jgi:N-methylhydantoinase B/oxoprolinase/acetone carboxylase alpha subunit
MRTVWTRRRLGRERTVYSDPLGSDEFVRDFDSVPSILLMTFGSAVKYQMKLHAGTLKTGDVLMSNSPQAGGSSVLNVILPPPRV